MLRNCLSDFIFGFGASVGYPLAQSYKFLCQSQHWSYRKLRDHQNHYVRLLVEHCYDHVPYYRDLLIARGHQPQDFTIVEDLAKFPYLTREIIRDHGERLRADNFPDDVCMFRRSGGTTGEPIRVSIDQRCRAIETAAFFRGLGWMGYHLGNPMVRLFGGSLGLPSKTRLRTRLRAWLLDQRFYPAFELGSDNLHEYVHAIQQATDGVMIGYSSAITYMSELMSAGGFQGSPLASVICTADFLSNEAREQIQSVLGAPVYAYYGCGEINSLGYECEGEEGYLVPEEHIVMEIEGDDPNILREEGRGQACITSLYNYAMPLIRYLNNDLLELRRFPEGLPHLRIVELEGRIMDQLVRADGTKISGAFVPHLVMKTGCPAWKYQLVQKNLEHLEFHYLVRDQGQLSTDMQDLLTQTLQKHFGLEIKVGFVEGDFVVPVSGKHRFVINHLT